MRPFFTLTDLQTSHPIKFYGPIDLGGVAGHTLPQVTLDSSTANDKDSQHAVVLGDRRGRGAVWTVFKMLQSSSPGNTSDLMFNRASVVIKMCRPAHDRHSNPSEYENESHDDDDAYSSTEISQAIRQEFTMYTVFLQHLQGIVVPRLFGCFVSSEELKLDQAGTGLRSLTWAFIMEDEGDIVQVEDLLYHQK